MKSVCLRLSMLSVSALLFAGTPALAADSGKDLTGFGVLRAPAADLVKIQAQEWLKSVNKADDAAFNAIWRSEESTLLEKVTETLVLGSPDAAKLMKDA